MRGVGGGRGVCAGGWMERAIRAKVLIPFAAVDARHKQRLSTTSHGCAFNPIHPHPHLHPPPIPRLLEMGFREEVAEVVRAAPRKRQTMLFSATFNDQVRELCVCVCGGGVGRGVWGRQFKRCLGGA